MKTNGNESIEWRPCHFWPEYEVSNNGLVRSWSGPGFSHKRRSIPKVKKQCLGKDGYLRVTFSRNSKSPNRMIETFTVHRLVAMCFLDGDKSLDVAHLDGNKTNNDFRNLKFVTRSENENHKRIHGTFTRGARIPIINASGLKAILALTKEGWTQKKIAFLFGVSQQTVCNALIKALNEEKQGE